MHLSDYSTMPFDLLIWATGAAPPEFIQETQLPTCAKGFLLVNTALQSVASEDIFASGDCITIQSKETMPKAGVYAVRMAPILTANITTRIKQLMQLSHGSMIRYEPQQGFLSLLSTGDGKVQ